MIITYFTFRYNMVFVPFTGIDNHKRCVTFGARLLTREDTDSYKWLLKCFLKAFGSPPKIIMSDQDPTIKKAVDELLPLSSHHLCIWHITTKLPKKVYIPLLFSTIEYSLQKNFLFNSQFLLFFVCLHFYVVCIFF